MAEHASYAPDPSLPTAQPSPTTEDYQRLLQEVSDLREYVKTREVRYQDDIVRERRRREQRQDELQQKILQLEHEIPRSNISVRRRFPQHSIASIDEEVPMNTPDRRLPRFSLDPLRSLNPMKNRLRNIASLSRQNSKSLDSSNRSDEANILEVTGGELEGTEIPLLPHDTFSFLAFSKLNSSPMFLSTTVVGIQVLTLTVLFLDMYNEGEPGNILGIPKGINQSTATIQVVAIFIMTIGQTDLHDSLNTLFIGYEAYDLSFALDTPVPKWRWTMSLWVRIFVTLYALAVTFILIVTESDTAEVLLDFTSIEFITNLDNILFWLCAYGYVGFGAQKDATLVLNAKPFSVILPKLEDDENDRKLQRTSRTSIIRTEATILGISKETSRTFPRFLFTSVLFFIMLAGWAVIFKSIREGDFLCRTIFVQFTDESTADLAPFTGLYDIGCSDGKTVLKNCRRSSYGEAQRGYQWKNLSHTAQFGYCLEQARWGFVFGDEPDDVMAGNTNPCKWLAHSKDVNPKEQDSYDIMSTASDPWKVLNRRQIDVPFEGLELQCSDCRHNPSFCGAPTRGDCVDNRCVCKNGWYGRRCEFNAPCELIEFTDPEQDLVNERKFATRYQRMYHEGEDRRPLEVYNRPVYEGTIDGGSEIGSTNQVFFNGLRWVMVTDAGNHLRSPEFHGFWSAKRNRYKVNFYSAAVRVDSPEDLASPEGLTWYLPKPKQRNRNVQGVDMSSEAPFKFLCATCNNETNPCLYEGTCGEGGSSCNCTSGSSGRLCQILPTGNGRCDPYFNNKEYAYDGGDCCKETCVSTDEHTCGREVVLDSQGVESIGFVGFDCKDPSVARAISGSRTIYDIKQRGFVQCGVILSTAWFYNFMADQCRAVAAAVLNDPNAIQLVNFTTDRFTGLRDGRFDIVFRTDHTASRDVYEISGGSGFSFATVPYYFGSFVFAGMKPFAKCANDGDFLSLECLDMKICLVEGTTWFDAASKVFPSESIVTYKDFASTVAGLENNECNVIGGSQLDVDLISVRTFGFTGDPENYEVGSQLYFKSFQSWMTSEGDRMWSRFTSWIFESLVQAEESNITQATSGLMGTTNVFGVEFNNVFRRAVAAVGNYGEMWERNMPFTRSGMNLVNDGSNGAMVSYGFGRVSDIGRGLSQNGVIRAILARDTLRCGVTGVSLGFSEYNENTNSWSGLGIDLCRGISAALFDGDDSKMVVSLVTTANRFSKIHNGEVDLVLDATRTLEREVRMGRTNFAFDFSPVYFHDGLIFTGEMPYALCAENQVFTNVNSLGLNCTGTKICVPKNTTWYDTLVETLRIGEENLLLTSTYVHSMQSHKSGLCNVVAGEHGRLNRWSLEDIGYLMTDNYYIGTRKLTKEPLCLMHRSDDPQFSDLIRWIVFGYFHAEENGITNETFYDMPETNLFGTAFTKIFQHSIRSVGNYAQIYERNIGEGFPRSGMNLLNELSSPQLFAAPGIV